MTGVACQKETSGSSLLATPGPAQIHQETSGYPMAQGETNVSKGFPKKQNPENRARKKGLGACPSGKGAREVVTCPRPRPPAVLYLFSTHPSLHSSGGTRVPCCMLPCYPHPHSSTGVCWCHCHCQMSIALLPLQVGWSVQLGPVECAHCPWCPVQTMHGSTLCFWSIQEKVLWSGLEEASILPRQSCQDGEWGSDCRQLCPSMPSTCWHMATAATAARRAGAH